MRFLKNLVEKYIVEKSPKKINAIIENSITAILKSAYGGSVSTKYPKDVKITALIPNNKKTILFFIIYEILALGYSI